MATKNLLIKFYYQEVTFDFRFNNLTPACDVTARYSIKYDLETVQTWKTLKLGQTTKYGLTP